MSVKFQKKEKAESSKYARGLVFLLLILYSTASNSLPTGSQVIAGQASIATPTAGHMQITQSSQNAIINWQSFSIGANQSVNIQQPNANSVQLDRVVGIDPSFIQGLLSSNGQIFLVNPNGVIFSNTAQVDVGGIVASTNLISNADFLNGNLHFTQGNTSSSVINQGQINTPNGGMVVLIGEQVQNSGRINSPQGSTVLAAGKTVDLDMKGDGLVEVNVTAAALNAEINNLGVIQANGGQVIMTAQSASQLLKTVINNEGVVEAHGLINKNGSIVLSGGDNGIVEVGGTLDVSGQGSTVQGGSITVSGAQIQVDGNALLNASGNANGGSIAIGDKQSTNQATIQSGASLNAQTLGYGKAGSITVLANMDKGAVAIAGQLNASAPQQGDGGSIETSAFNVKIADTAQITTMAGNRKSGTWLIDPADFTIGSGLTGTITTAGIPSGDISGATLSTALGLNNVTILSSQGSTLAGSGNINVNDAVSWSANTLLSLIASNNVNVNVSITATGATAGIAINPNTANGSETASGTGRFNLASGASINLPNVSASSTTALIISGKPYTVINTLGLPGSATALDLQGMNGDLAGNYALGSNLDASLTSTWTSFGGFTPVGNSSTYFTGAFNGLGHTITGLSINSYVIGVGLFGYVGNSSSISNLGLLAESVTGLGSVGGLVGDNFGSISNAYATGSVTATGGDAGGLVGTNDSSSANNIFGSVINTFATGSVTATGGDAGGLVGDNQFGATIYNAYALGNVTANGASAIPPVYTVPSGYTAGLAAVNAGGLVGYNYGFINNAYAAGKVNATSNTSNVSVGGLVGYNDGNINNAYATGGQLNGTGNIISIGGLVGFNDGDIKNVAIDTFNNPSAILSTSKIINNISNLVLNPGLGFISVSGVGGLAGVNYGSISDAYSTYNMSDSGGSFAIGGLVGLNYGSISNAYATGSVTTKGSEDAGGLVGDNYGTISNTYATGNIATVSGVAGGLVGVNYNTNANSVTNSFWDTQTTGQNTSAGGIGESTAAMMQLATYSSWNTTAIPNAIANTGGNGAVWRIYEGNTEPLLSFFLTPLTVNADNIFKTYSGVSDSILSNAIYSTDSLTIGGNLSSATISGNLFGTTNPYNTATNVGIYSPTGLYSNQQGYDISIINAVLSITPATLTYTATATAVQYGVSPTLTGTVTGFVGSDTLANATTGTAGFTSPGVNVGTYAVTGSGLVANNGNYLFSQAAGNATALSITPATLSVTANNAYITYDGLPYSGGNGVTYAGFAYHQTSSILTGTLTYGGNSQGAINAGLYTLIPGGLSSANYTITYNNGLLAIGQAQPSSAIIPIYTPNPPPLLAGSPLPSASFPSATVHDVTNTFTDSSNQNCDSFASFKQASTKQLIDCNNLIIPSLKVKNSAGRVMRSQMSANKQFLSLLLEDGSVRVWDFQRGEQHKIVNQNKNRALTGVGAVDNKGELISIASKAGIETQDIIIPTVNGKLAVNEANINKFMGANDGSLFLVSTGADQLSLWDSKQNKKLWQLHYGRGEVNSLALTDNKRYGAILSRQPGSYVLESGDLQLKSLTDAVSIIDIGSGKVIQSLPNLGEQILSMQFKNNDTLQLKLANGELLDWSITSNNLKTVANVAENVNAIDADNDTYAYILTDGTVRVGNGQGHIQLSIQNKENPFKEAKLLEGNKKLLTVMANGELSLWDVASGVKMLRLFSLKDGWAAMDAFGRFDGSEESLENFTWVANEEDIPLDSFSENYYEPGLVSSLLRNRDYLNNNPLMVKEGITLPPKVALQMADKQAKSDNVAVQLDIFDRGGGIENMLVYQNGKLLNNEKVIVSQEISQNNNAEHRVLTLNVTPGTGKNTLKVIASNNMGIENGSAELSFDGKTKLATSSIRILTIGIDKYSDSTLNLDYSVADASSIGVALTKSSKIASSKSLYNENATKPKILAELKEVSQGNQQDTLIIYFAGHGMALGKEWYFLPYETKMLPAIEQIAATGITATELGDIFKNTKMQHILVMVDSCYSGAATDSFNKLQIGQHYITRKLSRSLGITMITSTAKDKEAYELGSLGHGLFTYLMAQDIQKDDINHSAHSIAENIVKTLPAFSKKMVGYIQEPIAYTKGNDFMLTDWDKGASIGTVKPTASSLLK